MFASLTCQTLWWWDSPWGWQSSHPSHFSDTSRTSCSLSDEAPGISEGSSLRPRRFCCQLEIVKSRIWLEKYISTYKHPRWDNQCAPSYILRCSSYTWRMTRCIVLKLHSWLLQYSVEKDPLTLRNFPWSLGKTWCVDIASLWFSWSFITGWGCRWQGGGHCGHCCPSHWLRWSGGRGDWTSVKLLSAACQALRAIIVSQDTAGESWDEVG